MKKWPRSLWSPFLLNEEKNSLKILPFLYHSKIVFMQNRGFIKLNFKKGCG